jgi:hypothetical protein
MDQRDRPENVGTTTRVGASTRVGAWLFSLAAALWSALPLLATRISAGLLRWTLIREWLCLIHIRVLAAARCH